ncbi:hypothetical protein Hamer_G014874 [Homarus americanus]|uniref:Uncharacterized protein n=1 Tax=Homarus americanus TaxID=6706 RepID=A0A8J5JIT0_HOMAM|nr:hypothetical protein Hamer_G014874 [Homarus americanus]
MASTSGSGTKPKTRKDNEVWLIGPTAHALTALAQKTKEDEKQGMNPPFSSSSEFEEQVNSSASECSPPKKSKPGKPRAKNIMSPVLAKALDRTKISDRDAVHLIAAAAQTLGHNVEDIAVNRKTIRQSRMKLRVQSFKSAKEQFILNLDPTIPLVVHWDGKLLPETAGGKETYDRLPIIVSYEENEQLLNVSKLPNGTDVNDIHLEDFVSSATSKFFDMLNLPTDFLQLSPSLWQTNAGYCKAQKKLKTMKVVNDVAERGVALIQDYIHVITKDEEQRQFLLQVVSDHRKNFPNSLKRTVIEALKKNDLCC